MEEENALSFQPAELSVLCLVHQLPSPIRIDSRMLKSPPALLGGLGSG